MTENGTRVDRIPSSPQTIALGETRKSLPFHDALRLQQSFTAHAERKVLTWLAGHMPTWVNSDHLTLLGFAAMFFAGASYAFARTSRAGLLLATFFLAVNWFGDSLDGTLARIRNRQRPRYGFYVDHMVDTFGGLFLMGGIAIPDLMDWRIALGLFIAYLMLSVQVYLATYTVGTFQLSFAKFGPTEIRILLALGNVVLWVRTDWRVLNSAYRLFDLGGIIAMAAMMLMLVASTIYNTAKLYRAETPR